MSCRRHDHPRRRHVRVPVRVHACFFFFLSSLSDHVIACHFHTAEGGGGGGGGVGELNGGWVAGVGWAMLWVSDGIQRVESVQVVSVGVFYKR